MSITRYRGEGRLNPWQELDQVTTRLGQLFGDRLAGDLDGSTWMPAVNVEETGDELVLTAELPGMKREDVEIELENNVLTIRGRKEDRREGSEDRRYHVWERRYGAFQRSFSLPRTVAADQIAANFDNGVLRVRMPKAAEAKGRRIEIEGGA